MLVALRTGTGGVSERNDCGRLVLGVLVTSKRNGAAEVGARMQDA